MRMPKVWLAILLCAALLLCAGSALARDEQAQKPLLLYFFENYCDSCRPEEEFINSFSELTGHKIS